MNKPTESRIAQVMVETGMARIQAYYHERARLHLLARMNNGRRAQFI